MNQRRFPVSALAAALAALLCTVVSCAGPEFVADGRVIGTLAFTAEKDATLPKKLEENVRGAVSTRVGERYSPRRVTADRKRLREELGASWSRVDADRDPADPSGEKVRVRWTVVGLNSAKEDGEDADSKTPPWSPEGREIESIRFVSWRGEALAPEQVAAIEGVILTRIGERYQQTHVDHDRETLRERGFGTRSDVVAGQAGDHRRVGITWRFLGEVTPPAVETFVNPLTGDKTPWTPTAGGTVFGIVSWSGAAPPLPAAPSCDSRSPLGLISVRDNRVRGAVVTLTPTRAGLPPAPGRSAPIIVRSAQCRASPAVVAARAGAVVWLRNDDNVVHHFTAPGFPDVIVQPRSKALIATDKPGSRRYIDRLHPWQWLWLYVASSPYATVTDGQGRFILADVPEGDYEIRVWHPDLTVKRPQSSVVRVRVDRAEQKGFVLAAR